MKTSDLSDLDPLDEITLPTAPTPGRMEALGRGMKRGRRRILGQFGGEHAGGQAYHVMSRTAGGEKVFGDTEKEAFRRLMWRKAKFFDVEIWPTRSRTSAARRVFPTALRDLPHFG